MRDDQTFYLVHYWSFYLWHNADVNTRALSFNEKAKLYDRVRPDYPSQTYLDLKKNLKLNENSRILEVGCGTGQATKDLLQITSNLVSLDPGENMIDIARKNLPSAEFIVSKFENYRSDQKFDLIIAATAWHWVNPKAGYSHASSLLKNNGHLVILRNFHVETNPDAFHIKAQKIYQRHRNKSPRDLSSKSQIEEAKEELDNDYFHVVSQIEHEWFQQLSIDEYIQLRRSYSDHIAMNPDDREKFEAELIEFANEHFNGMVNKRYLAVLIIAAKN